MHPSILLSTAVLLSFPLTAEGPGIKRAPASYTHPASGAVMYTAYCASCHGTKAAGDGPVATHLKVAIPDLTRLAAQNQGVFPGTRVAQVIRGEVEARAHGLQEMPVWGPVFRALDGRQEAMVHVRVANLTKHLEGLQVK